MRVNSNNDSSSSSRNSSNNSNNSSNSVNHKDKEDDSSNYDSISSSSNSSSSTKTNPSEKFEFSRCTGSVNRDLLSALLTGAITAAVFNPWDKALYLSSTTCRPLLSRENWANPFRCTLQAFAGRFLSTGLYFPIEDYFCCFFQRVISALQRAKEKGYTNNNKQQQQQQQQQQEQEQEQQQQQESSKPLHYNAREISGVCTLQPFAIFMSGIFSGICCSFLSHPFTVIKYICWNNNTLFFPSLINIIQQGGIKGFYRGFAATLVRDSLFGGVYTSTRLFFLSKCSSSSRNRSSSSSSSSSSKGYPHQEQQEGPQEVLLPSSKEGPPRAAGEALNRQGRERVLIVFGVNTFAACIGVLASSPLNYVRNVQLAAPTHAEAPCMRSILKSVGKSFVVVAAAAAAKRNPQGLRNLSNRLLWGWGTLRAAAGMGFGSVVYDLCTRVTVHTP